MGSLVASTFRWKIPLLLATLVAGFAPVGASQDVAILRIKVTVVDPDGRVRPVPRHALLISDNPTSAAPRRVVTSPEGVAEVRLPPGNYTVESDQPLVFQGKAYEWRQTLDVARGKDTVLELTATNAQAETTTAAASMRPGESSPSELLMQWQDTVVTIWTPTARGSAFLVDPRGLLLTNQRIVRTATTVEVQLTLTKKVAARVLVANATRNIAVLWVDPSIAAALKPARLGYAQDATPSVGEGQEVFAIDAAAIDQKSLASGNVTRVDTHTIATDLRVDENSSGAPLLTASGDTVGIITRDDSGRRTHAIRIDDARAAIAEAEKKMQGTPPAATLLPVEPQRPFPQDALDAAVKRRASGANGYELHSSDFDVTFITPTVLYAAHHLPDRTTGAKTAGGTQNVAEIENSRRALLDFGGWSDYVQATPPVVLVRATPRLVEGFWTTVGRMAARTQGMDLPAFKKMKSSFARMRLYCGDTEVTPIHPFVIERQLDDTNSVAEGLYVYDAASLGQCAKVTLSLFSVKEPDKADTKVVDAKLLERIATDFAPYAERR